MTTLISIVMMGVIVAGIVLLFSRTRQNFHTFLFAVGLLFALAIIRAIIVQ